jgi:hypothetical protein
MKRKSIIKLLIPVIGIFIASCRLIEVPFTEVELAIEYLKQPYKLVKMVIQLNSQIYQTGRTVTKITDSLGIATLTLEEGVYNIEVTAEKTLVTTLISADSLTQTFTQTVNIRGLLQKSLIKGNEVSFSVPLLIAQMGNGFIIKEIYFAGSTTPANGSYYQDQFIEIFNNSDSVLYADGLSIVESSHLSSNAIPEYTEYPNDLIVGALYTIPGDGKTYPVEPGKSIVIASLGINHKNANANSPVICRKPISNGSIIQPM